MLPRAKLSNEPDGIAAIGKGVRRRKEVCTLPRAGDMAGMDPQV